MVSSKNKMNVHIYGFWMLKKNKYWDKILKKKNPDVFCWYRLLIILRHLG